MSLYVQDRKIRFLKFCISLDEDGGAEAITAPVDIAAAKDDFDKFIYSGLDLKCNRMENAFKAGMEQLFGFVDKYLELIGVSSHLGCEIDITFNRDIAINESQAITDCQNSKGVISDETIIKNHPWVEDAEGELNRLKDQEEAARKELSDMFPEQAPEEDSEGGDE